MKKCYYRVTAVFFCAAIFMAGCGGSDKKSGEAVSSTEEAFAADILDYNVEDYVKLGEYKNLKVQYPLPYVSNDDVEMCVSQLIEDYTEYNEVGRGMKNGDYINIDFTGTIDGKEFENGSEESCEFTMGNHEFLDDFEKNILGKKAGEEFSFKMTFPKEYDESVAGKEVEFTGKVNSVCEVVVPEYTDEFVAKNTDYSEIEEYEEAMREELFLESQQESYEIATDDALAQVMDNSKIDGYPQALYDYYYADNSSYYESIAEVFGVGMEEYLSDFEGETLDSITLKKVNEALMYQAIIEKEGLEITDKNYPKEAENLALEYGYETLKEFEGDYSEVEIRLLLNQERALDFLYENSDVEEVSQEEYYGDDEYLEDDTEYIPDGTEYVLDGTELILDDAQLILE